MVSVIIPVYNGEKYIARCLDSVLFDAKDIEVIAVNDGSKDSSSAILHEYAEKYAFLRVIDKENGGAASARRAGLDAAVGEYIAFLDIDDYVESGMYTLLAEKARQSGADIVFCDYIEECSKGKREVKSKFHKNEAFPLTSKAARYYLHSRKAYFPFPWNKIYRAELIKKVSFPDGNFVGEDYNMHLQLMEMAEKIEYLDFCLYHYMLTENSASRTGYSDATLRAYNHFKEDFEMVAQKYPDEKKDVAHYLAVEFMACIIAMGRNKKYNKEMIKEIKRFMRRNLFSFLFDGNVPLVMKCSAIALCISYRLLTFVYGLVK